MENKTITKPIKGYKGLAAHLGVCLKYTNYKCIET